MKRLRFLLAGAATAALLAVAPSLALASPDVITRFAGVPSGCHESSPGPATSFSLCFPTGVAVDARGDVYVADQFDPEVVKITPEGTLSVIAGDGTEGAPTEGPATSSQLGEPQGVAVDASGNVYIADTSNHVVEKVTPAGELSVIAGRVGESGLPTEGPALESDLYEPSALAVDASGDVYIADHSAYVIEKVTPTGALSIVAGKAGEYGAPTEGPARSSHLGGADGVAVDASGNIYIGDYENFVVEKVTPGGHLSVIAGDGERGKPVEGPAASSPLNTVFGVAVDQSGNVYLIEDELREFGDCELDEVSGGTLSVLAGAHTCGSANVEGPPLASPLDFPWDVAVNSAGVLYISENLDGTISRIGPETPAPPTIVSATPGNDSAVIVFDPPVSPGTSPVTSYQVSTDGGASWQTITPNAGPDATLEFTLTGLTDGTTYPVMLRALNANGTGPTSGQTPVTPRPATSAGNGAPAPAENPAVPAVRCRSARTERIHWQLSRGVTLRRIIVTVNGRTYARLPGSARSVTVSLLGRGRGRVNVEVLASSASGLQYGTTRAFEPCEPARGAGVVKSLVLTRR